MSCILVTGANGFVGRELCQILIECGHIVHAVTRRQYQCKSLSTLKYFTVKDICENTLWESAIKGVDCVIHLAARVHVMVDNSRDPLSVYREVNTKGTMNLARQALKAGVKRFVYISSIKVNGECTTINIPYTDTDNPAPSDPYAISKYEAEQQLLELSSSGDLEIVIIRPPLVYGPGVKANFLSMLRWLNKGIPLPFGSIQNKRSLVALDNLVDLILTCIEQPAAANQIFLVSDGEDLSTTELLSRVASALGKKPRLLPVNQQLLELILRFIGKKDLAQRLCSSLQVDISKAKKLLNWTPPVSVDEGLRKTADAFKSSR